MSINATTGNAKADKIIVAIARDGGSFICSPSRLRALLNIVGPYVTTWSAPNGGISIDLTDDAALLADLIRNRRSSI